MLVAGGAACLIPIAPHRLHAETITFAAATLYVLEKLASGALQYVGGEIMRNILGQPSIGDVRKWIAQAVKELKIFFRQELKAQLDEQSIKEIAARLAGANNSLRQYFLLSPEGQRENRFLIEQAYEATGWLLPYSFSFKELTYVSIAAMSYRQMSINGLYALTNDKGFILASNQEFEDFANTIDARRSLGAATTNPSNRMGLACDFIGGAGERTGEPGVQGHARCSIFLDGAIYASEQGATSDRAMQRLEDTRGQLRQKLQTEHEAYLTSIDTPLALIRKTNSALQAKL